MAISTYSELKTAVANWSKRDDLTSIVPDLIALCEARVYVELRTRDMEQSINSTVSSGVIAVPSGYMEMKYLYVDGSPTSALERMDAEAIVRKYPIRASDGRPKFFGVDGSNIIFGPYPDSAYTIKGVYYKRPDALSDSNTTNWLLTNHPNVLLFGALCELEPYVVNDARIAVWEGKYQAALAQVIAKDRREAFSGSPISVKVS